MNTWQPLTANAPRGVWLRVRDGDTQSIGMFDCKGNYLGKWFSSKPMMFRMPCFDEGRETIDELVAKSATYQLLGDVP